MLIKVLGPRIPPVFLTRKALLFALTLMSISLFFSSIRSSGFDSETLEVNQKEIFNPLLVPNNPRLAIDQDLGLRPVPANRLDSATTTTDEYRNPFLLDNVGNISAINSVRLTGIVHDGQELIAFIEDGSFYESLTLGDLLSLGNLKGSGFRLVAISFEQGSVSVSNGFQEYKINIQQ